MDTAPDITRAAGTVLPKAPPMPRGLASLLTRLTLGIVGVCVSFP